jgi:hypothetical protein
MAGCVPYTCHPSYSRKDLGLGCPCHKVRSYLQNNQRKKAGGIVQKVAHQPNKSEALNSNLSTTKKRKEKKKISINYQMSSYYAKRKVFSRVG